MPLKAHEKTILVLISLYLVATWTSIAGMEIFGWATFIAAVTYAFRCPKISPATFSCIGEFLPWKTMIAIVLITIIGIFKNGHEGADELYAIGSQRWVFLLLSTSIALTLWPPTLKGYRFFLVVTGVIAVYGVFQSFTGIDLLRPGENRAVQGLDVKGPMKLWRTAGLFGSPMHYIYVVGQHACLPLAVAFLFPKEQSALRKWSLFVFALIFASLMTTYVRGGWIAMGCAYLVMAYMVSRKVFAYVVGAGAVAAAGLFAALPGVRERVMQLFDMGYTSNSDRLLLWKANWIMFTEYPVWGVGYSENETLSGKYLTAMGFPNAFTGHAHNTYLQWLAGAGLTGFLAYMLFITFFLWLTVRLYRRLPVEAYWPRALTLAALGAQVHVHVGGFTEANFKAGVTNHNFMVTLAIVASLAALEAKGLIGQTARLALPQPAPRDVHSQALGTAPGNAL